MLLLPIVCRMNGFTLMGGKGSLELDELTLRISKFERDVL
jgi:hypothetical protein